MRRRDKEITDRSRIDEIIAGCEVCRLGLARVDTPYVVPVSFAYDGESIFIHTAREGTKIEYFESNPLVCVEFEHDVRVVRNDLDPCAWSFRFESVIGYGRIVELTDPKEKTSGLQKILFHYSQREWPLRPSMMTNTRVWKIPLETVTGKRSGEKLR